MKDRFPGFPRMSGLGGNSPKKRKVAPMRIQTIHKNLRFNLFNLREQKMGITPINIMLVVREDTNHGIFVVEK